MRRTPRVLLILGVALLSLGVGAVVPRLLAAPTSAIYMPVVATGAPPLQTTPMILYDGASSLNSAVAMRDTRPGAGPGALRFFVAWSKVPAYQLEVAEDVDGVLVPVPQAPAALLAALASGPAWSPDLPKNGGAALIPVPGGLRIYYTGRKMGDPTGVFVLWRAEIPVAGVAP